MEINEDDGGTTLYIRAVNLSSGELIAMCKATIVYDAATDTHHLDALTSSDVVDTGEMTQDEKSVLVQDAITFMQGRGISPRPLRLTGRTLRLRPRLNTCRSPISRSSLIQKVSRFALLTFHITVVKSGR